MNQQCDGIVDCLDLADELIISCDDDPTELRCNATTTVPVYSYCDGIIDCVANARDEQNCFTCPLSGIVVPKEFVCDGEIDCCTSSGTCDDESDEASCP